MSCLHLGKHKVKRYFLQHSFLEHPYQQITIELGYRRRVPVTAKTIFSITFYKITFTVAEILFSIKWKAQFSFRSTTVNWQREIFNKIIFLDGELLQPWKELDNGCFWKANVSWCITTIEDSTLTFQYYCLFYHDCWYWCKTEKGIVWNRIKS